MTHVHCILFVYITTIIELDIKKNNMESNNIDIFISVFGKIL